MKRIVGTLAIFVALAFAAVALAGNGRGGGGGISAHLARIQTHVTKYEQKCQVANPAPNCAAKKAKLTDKLTAFETRLDRKIAKSPNAARFAELTSARAEVISLLGSL